MVGIKIFLIQFMVLTIMCPCLAGNAILVRYRQDCTKDLVKYFDVNDENERESELEKLNMDAGVETKRFLIYMLDTEKLVNSNVNGDLKFSCRYFLEIPTPPPQYFS